MESSFASLAQVWKVLLQHQHKCGKWFSNTNISVESGFASLVQVWKVVFNTNTSVESGFATPTQVWKVVLHHWHKCGKWFSTLTQVWKVVLKHEQKCEKWFCIASTSVESGFATRPQVGKVVFNTNRSAKSGFQH